MVNKKNPNNYYGTKHIPPEAFEPKNIKFRITTMIDLDILDALKKEAEPLNMGYQTLINLILRSYVDRNEAAKVETPEEAFVRRIVREELLAQSTIREKEAPQKRKRA